MGMALLIAILVVPGWAYLLGGAVAAGHLR